MNGETKKALAEFDNDTLDVHETVHVRMRSGAAGCRRSRLRLFDFRRPPGNFGSLPAILSADRFT